MRGSGDVLGPPGGAGLSDGPFLPAALRLTDLSWQAHHPWQSV